MNGNLCSGKQPGEKVDVHPSYDKVNGRYIVITCNMLHVTYWFWGWLSMPARTNRIVEKVNRKLCMISCYPWFSSAARGAAICGVCGSQRFVLSHFRRRSVASRYAITFIDYFRKPPQVPLVPRVIPPLSFGSWKVFLHKREKTDKEGDRDDGSRLNASSLFKRSRMIATVELLAAFFSRVTVVFIHSIDLDSIHSFNWLCWPAD